MPSPRLKSAPHYTPQRLCALTLCLLLAYSSACARAGRQNYFPLSAAAHWEYAGRLSSSRGQFDVPATMRVEGETIIRGRRYYKYVIDSDLSAMMKAPRHTHEVRYYRVAQDGIYFLPGQDTGGEELLEMPLPIPVGVSWVSGPAEVRAEHAGTVKAGGHEYADCLKLTYSGEGGTNRIEYYLAPGVGVVKAVIADVVGPGSSLELTLVKYQL